MHTKVQRVGGPSCPSCFPGLGDGNFTGIKMIGDNYVPAGKPSTFINTADSDNTADTINVTQITLTLSLGMWQLALTYEIGLIIMSIKLIVLMQMI